MILVGSGLVGLGLLILMKSQVQRTLYRLESLQRVHEELMAEKLAQQHLFFSLRRWKILWISCLIVTFFAAAFTLHYLFFALGLILLLLPNWILQWAAARRRKRFLSQFGECIPQMVSTLRSGQTLHRALSLIIETHSSPLRQELAYVLKQVRLGTSLERALEDLRGRYDHVDVETFVRAVAVSKKLGSNLAESLEHVGNIFRTRKMLRHRVAALTAQGRAQAAIAIAMPFALSLIIELISPGYLSPLFHQTAGNLILVFSGLFLLMGAFFIFKICRADWLQ